MSDWMYQEAQIISLTILVSGLLFFFILWLRTRKQLTFAKNKFHDITRHSLHGIYVIQDGRYVFANEAFLHAFGMTREELFATDVSKFFDFIIDPEVRAKLLEHYQTRKHDPESRDQWELHIRNGAGTERWVSANIRDITYDGRPAIQGTMTDITDRIEAERIHQQSATSLTRLTEMTSAAFYIFHGPEMVYVNPQAERITGYSSEELLNMNFWDILHPDFRDLVRQRGLSRQQGSEVEDRYQVKIITKDGAEKWIDYSATMIEFDGQPAVLGTGIDITELKLAEESLRESEERYRTLFDQSPDSIVQFDPTTGSILAFNDHTHTNLEYTREEFEKLTVTDFDIIETPEVTAERIASIMKRGHDSFETQHRTKTGEIRDVHVATQVVHLGSRRILQSVWHDITDIKEAHAEADKFKYIADHANYGHALFAPDGTITYVNNNWATMHGFSVSELEGKKIWFVHADENVPNAKAIFRRALATDFFGPVELQHKRRDGSTFPCLGHGLTVRDNDGQPLYMASNLVDMTPVKEAEQALKESEEKLRFVLDNAPSFIIMLDLKGCITFASRSQSGQEVDDLIGTNALDLLSPDYKKFSLSKFRQVIKTGATVDYECPGPGPKGTTAWYHCRLAPVMSGEKVMALSVVATDITQRKQKEIRDTARLQMLEKLRDAASIDECLNLACCAIEQSELFRRAVLTLHNDKREIANIGYVGLSEEVIKVARQAPPPDTELTAQMTRDEYRLSNSFFIPQEAGLPVESSERYVAQSQLQTDSRDDAWRPGDELFTPVMTPEASYGGWLSVDTPFDGLRPDAEVALALEEIIDIVTQKIREIQTLEKLRLGLSDLRVSEERLSTLAKALPAGIFRTDADGQISYLNDLLLEMTGMTVNDMKDQGWAKGIHPDDRDRVVSVRNQAHRENLPWKAELRFIRSDGRQFWLMLQSVPQFQSGTVTGYVGAIVDITDRKDMEQALQESERRNATLLSSAPDGIVAVDTKTRRQIFVNPAICRMTGYSREVLLQMKSSDWVPEDFKKKADELFGKMASGAIHSVTDIPLVRKDGTIISVEITGGLAELDGETALIGFFRDITDLKAKEKLLTHQQRRLKKLSNLMIELQENDRKLVARELHDSVAQKLALAKIRLEEVALDATGQDKDSFTIASAVISDAINDLRNISAGLRPQLLDDLGLVAAIKWYIKQGDKAIVSTCSVVGREYPIEQYKQVNIFRICQEFVLNAHKHSEANSLTVKLEFLPGQFVLSVMDDGKGFNYDEIIARGPSTTSFGLTNIVERVDIINGRLVIDSSAGAGTRIKVSVPID